ncbi:MAG: chorismate mutase [Pseudomonadota bacterium]|nr:chorismate mutase [Pseudomonadota bacterium]
MRHGLRYHRDHIDALDGKILELLAARFDAVRLVAACKARQDIPARIPSRIRAVIDSREDRGRALGLPEKAAFRIWSAIVEESCRLEECLISGVNPNEEYEMAKAKKRVSVAKKKSARSKTAMVKPAKKAAKKSAAKRPMLTRGGSKPAAKRPAARKAPARKVAKTSPRSSARRSTPAPMPSPAAKRQEEMPGTARGTVFERKPPASTTREPPIAPAREDTSRTGTRPAEPYTDEPDDMPEERAPDLPPRRDPGTTEDRPGLPDDDEPETDPGDPWKPRPRE